MRLLVHKGQALLLLVVGGLAGAVLAGALLERNGLSAPVATKAAELMAPPTSRLPARIEIGSRSQPPAAGATTATREAGQAAAIAAAVSPSAVPVESGEAPTLNTTVVPPTVYSYPPDDHGRGGGPGSGSGSGRGGHD